MEEHEAESNWKTIIRLNKELKNLVRVNKIMLKAIHW